MIHIAKGLEPLWDNYLIDSRLTDAELSVNKPQRVGTAMVLDKPWEGSRTCYFHVFKDEDIYRMYYTVTPHGRPLPGEGLYACYAESRDGVKWERPELGIYEYDGNKENNILFGPEDLIDGFFVMKDENPQCPPNMRYKAVTQRLHENGMPYLMCFVSGDGVHFEEYGLVSDGYHYDSLNVLLWNKEKEKYYLFLRCRHEKPEDETSTFKETTVRDLIVTESEDFVHWSEAKLLDFHGAEDYPLYTNAIESYLYDGRYFIGFPTRYNERRDWSANFERLCGREERLERMDYSQKHDWEHTKRYGLAITDCVFMSSRDGYNWYRFDEACITPGPERDINWVYGDCYPAVGLYELPSRFEGEPTELSQLVKINHNWAGRPVQLEQYIWRRDGFASYKAGYQKKKMVTKPFCFDADTISMNFRTSARGGVYVRILDELSNPIAGYETCELFGDSVERIVDFEKPLEDLHGKKIRLEFTMSDAEIYALKFS